MPLPRIQRSTARRYVLGTQGLWPGRRWSGKEGTAAALTRCETVQIDPISVIHRSHDLALSSRVLDYDPADLDRLLYSDRAFFDYGRILMIYPRRDLPFVQNLMHGHKERHAAWAETHRAVIDFVRDEIQARGPLTSREFVGRTKMPGGFNSVKDTTHALWRLWDTGELMTHGRRNFDRVYDLFENVVGSPFHATIAQDTETLDHFARKTLNDVGLANAAAFARRYRALLHPRVTPSEARERPNAMVKSGQAVAIEVEGMKEPWYVAASGLDDLMALEHAAVPDAWAPIAKGTSDEVAFIAPLDNAIWDRPRTAALFDFDYVWEVYKPASVRRWGYYTLPILFEDRLVARIDLKLDRKAKRLVVSGFWLDETNLGKSRSFANALAAGLKRLLSFHSASSIGLSGIEPPALRGILSKSLPA